MDTTTIFQISGAGLAGTLQFTWVDDNLAHIIEHAEADEPSGTWTGFACPDHGLEIGSDVDIELLKQMSGNGKVADLVWEAPDDLSSQHNEAFVSAMRALDNGDTRQAELIWEKLQDIWSHAWAANYKVLEFMQDAEIDQFTETTPQRWVVASFEHHCGPHGIQKPHVHNIVVVHQAAEATFLGATQAT